MASPIEITNKAKCCGCSACYAACPNNCISMKPDDEGFDYPQVDRSACIECGKCVKACPLVKGHELLGAESVRLAFAVANKDEAVRASSTSGGAFDALVKATLAKGGLVVGARYDKDMQVLHSMADTEKESSLFYGSKYVQSNLIHEDVFRKTEEALKLGRTVLFSGTPCQVQGLRVFLGKEYSNLLTVDFICRAVPSPRIWNEYLYYMESKYKSKVQKVTFRNKTYGYHSGTMKIVFDNGKVYYGSGRVDYMHKAYFSDLISRPSCYDCAFRHVERSSDFTLFDCWSFKKHTGLPDDDLGHTHLWVHSAKGAFLLDSLNDTLVMEKVSFVDVVKDDGVMATQNIAMNDKRPDFMNICFSEGIHNAVKNVIPVSKFDYFLESIKGALSSMGVLSALSKVKRARKHDAGN